MSTPKLSVCMPVRDAGPHLHDAVASALAQDIELELLLHDDASTDGCVERLGALRADPRVRVERSALPLGVATARNRLVARARARFVAFLDADDVLLPGALRRTCEALRSRPRAVLAHGDFELIDDVGRTLPDWEPPFDSGRTLSSAEASDELLLRNFLTTSTVTARREALLRAGPFDGRIGPSSTDWDMWLRLAEAGDVVYVPERIARYRQHETTISASTRAGGARLRSDARVVRRAVARRRGGPRPVPSRLRRQAEAALVVKALTQAGDDATRGDRIGALRALTTASRAAPWIVRADGPALAAAVAAGSEYAVYRRSKALLALCARYLAGTRVGARAEREAAVDTAYEASLRRAATAVRSSVPRDARVAAIDKWDPTLLRLSQRRGRHFPDRRHMPDGYPPDSEAAVEHLELLRAEGVDHLAVPASSSWWLDHYDGLREHLAGRYRLVAADKDCSIWDLTGAGR